MKISVKVVFLFVGEEKYSTIVIGGNILDFHFFEALNDNFEASFFTGQFLHVTSDILIACRAVQLRFFKLGKL